MRRTVVALQHRLSVDVCECARQHSERDDSRLLDALRIVRDEEPQCDALEHRENHDLRDAWRAHRFAHGALARAIARDEVRRRQRKPERPDLLEDSRNEEDQREVSAVFGAERARNDDACYDECALAEEARGN